MSDNTSGDLNQVIASAVQARIESEVAAALSGSEVMGQYVAAALTQKIEIDDPRDRYKKVKTTFLRQTIDGAIKEATAAAVRKLIEEERPAIEKAVNDALKANTKKMAAAFMDSVTSRVSTPYGVNVELRWPGE